MSNALVGLLTLRLPSLGWVFLASSLRLRFPFYLGPLSPVYLLVATQGLAACSCFTMQSFWYSLKDLLAQLSASIYQQSSCFTILSVYWYFCSTHSPSVLEIRVFLFFEFWDPVLSFGSVWGSLGRIERLTSRRGSISPSLIQRA